MALTRRRLILSAALLPLGRPSPAAEATSAIAIRAEAGVASLPLHYAMPAPGPVLRVAHGAPLRIALENGLSRPTSLDLHGMAVPAPLGGVGPLGGTIPAGGRAEIAVVPPDTGTSWFHPWILDPHEDQTAEGLAGVLVVEEPAPPAVDADLVAVIADRWPIVGPGSGPDADALRIDGAARPRHETLRPGSRVRLRLVNASTRRAVGLRLTGAAPFVAAIDGQPSDLFRPRGDSLPAGPGARFDLLFDLPPAGSDPVRILVGPEPDRDTELLIVSEGEPRPAREPIRPLPPNPRLPPAIPLERALRSTLVAARRGPEAEPVWTLNGVCGRDLPKAPLFRAKRGTPVVLALRNASPELVSYRVHGAAMRLLHDLDDGWEPYWRDAILVPPGATHHAAFVADLPGHWLVESPFFAQAAGGLRGWFEIT